MQNSSLTLQLTCEDAEAAPPCIPQPSAHHGTGVPLDRGDSIQGGSPAICFLSPRTDRSRQWMGAMHPRATSRRDGVRGWWDERNTELEKVKGEQEALLSLWLFQELQVCSSVLLPLPGTQLVCIYAESEQSTSNTELSPGFPQACSPLLWGLLDTRSPKVTSQELPFYQHIPKAAPSLFSRPRTLQEQLFVQHLVLYLYCLTGLCSRKKSR